MNWEYKFVDTRDASDQVAANLLGQDGWELVSVLMLSNCHEFRYYYKRPIAVPDVQFIAPFKLTPEEEAELAESSRFRRQYRRLPGVLIQEVFPDEDTESFLNGVRI